MKKLYPFILLLTIGYQLSISKTLTIQPLNGSLIIDGRGDEAAWGSVAFVDMVQHKGDVANKNNTAKYKMCYDAQYLYVYIEVTDYDIDTSQSANIWEKDNIIMHISMDTVTKVFNNVNENGFYNFFKVYGRKFTDINYNSFKGINVAEFIHTYGYTQEWCLPIDSLANTTKNFNKKTFKLDIENGDNDGSGRNSQLFWNSNADDQWCSNKNMGTIVLGGNNPLLASHKSLNISKIPYNINIDGVNNDAAWSLFDYTSMDQVYGTDVFNNNTAKFKMTYDSTNIFILTEINDLKYDTSESVKLSNKDGVVLYFNMDTSTRTNLVNGQNGFYMIRKVWGRNIWNAPISSFKVAEKQVAGGYIQEWSFPIKTLASTTTKFNNKAFRFEIENDDNDGSGCNRRLFWCSNAYDQATSSKNQGIIYMKEQIYPPIDPAYDPTNKKIDVYNTLSPVTLDGNGTESAWKSISYVNMDEHKGDPINKNNTAKFKMTYDTKFLYVFVTVLDSHLDTSQSKNVWEKDCVELYLSLDTTSSLRGSAGANGFYQLRKIFGRPLTDFASKGFLVSEVETFGGRTQEWRLSFDSVASTLKDKSKWDKKNFRFECVNSDNDGAGRNSQLFWNSNSDDSWGPGNRHMGYVTLKKSNSINKTEFSSIKVSEDYIHFTESTDYTLFNTAGMVLRKGNNSNGFSIADLKKGIYIICTNKEHIKICK